jgi:hypothetical protein
VTVRLAAGALRTVLLALAVTVTGVCQAKQTSVDAAAADADRGISGKAKEPVAPPSTNAKPAKVSADRALAGAAAWLAGMKSRNVAKVRAASQIPIAYRSLGLKELCERVATSEKQLDDMIRCFIKKDTLFIGELKRCDDLNLKVVEAGRAPAKLSALLTKEEAEQTLVFGYINGDGVTYQLLLAMAPAKNGTAVVSTLLIWAEFLE